jgi:YVTN family beta-propeller protein
MFGSLHRWRPSTRVGARRTAMCIPLLVVSIGTTFVIMPTTSWASSWRVATLDLGQMPNGVAVDPASGTAYVTDAVMPQVQVVDLTTRSITATVSISLPEGTDLQGSVAVDPKLHAVAVGTTDGSIFIISTSTLQVSGPIEGSGCGSAFSRIAIDAATGIALVGSGDGGLVCAFNLKTHSFITSVGVGLYPDTIVFDKANGLFYVSASGDGTITAVNGRSMAVTATFQVNADYTDAALALDSRTQTLYMTNSAAKLVSYVSAASGTVDGTVDTDEYAYDSEADDPGAKTLFVCNEDGTVSVIDTTTEMLVQTITVGSDTTSSPAASAFDPKRHQVLVTNAGDDTLVFLKRP